MAQWVDIGPVDMVEDDDVIQVMHGAYRLAVYKVDGEVHVTDDRCTHQEASLAEGYLDGTEIECPRHQGVFDICTGRALTPPLEHPLRVYEVRTEQGRILVAV